MARGKTNIRVDVPASRVPVIEGVLKRIEKDPDELYYFEALIDVIESVDTSDRETMRSAMLSRVAVTCPWLLDRVAKRARGETKAKRAA